MLNAFPQGAASNAEVLLRTYEAVLADSLPEAVVKAAQRFTTGKVPNQSMTFSPSVAEFVAEVERQEEYISIKARPRIAAPEYRPTSGGMPPFMVTRIRLLAENANRQVLFEDINFDQFRKLSAAREIPVGGKWVAALGIIYGPEPKQSRQAAE